MLAGAAVGAWVGYGVMVNPLALAGPAAVALLLVMADRVELGILFIGLYAPYEEFFLKFLPANASNVARYGPEVFIAAMLASVWLHNIAQGKRFRMTPIDAPLALFLFWALISAVANGTDPITAILGLRIVLRYVLLYYVIVHAGLSSESVRRFVKLFLVAAGIEMAIGVATGLIGGEFRAFFQPQQGGVSLGDVTIGRFSTGTATSATMLFSFHFGTFVAISWLLVFGLRLAGWLRSRWTIAFLALGLAAVIESLARESLVALMAGFLVVLFAAGYRKLGVRLVTGIGVVAILAVVCASVLVPRIPGTATTLSDKWLSAIQLQNMQPAVSSNFRLFLLFDLSGKLLSRSPLWGLGPGTYGSALSVARGDPIYSELGVSQWANNRTNFVSDVNWVTFLGQFGIVGTLLFVLALFAMLKYDQRCLEPPSSPFSKGLALGHMGCIAIVAVSAFFSPVFEVRPIAVYLWLFGGLIMALTGSSDRIAGPFSSDLRNSSQGRLGG